MYKIKIITIGKSKEKWLQDALEEYTERLKPSITIEWILAKDNEKLKQLLEKVESYICLDPRGKLLSSEQFSDFLIDEFQKKGSRLNFVIGEAEGLTPEIKKGASHQLSLSPLTFTHQLTRLIFLEQLYRAIEIDKGSAYHK